MLLFESKESFQCLRESLRQCLRGQEFLIQETIEQREPGEFLLGVKPECKASCNVPSHMALNSWALNVFFLKVIRRRKQILNKLQLEKGICYTSSTLGFRHYLQSEGFQVYHNFINSEPSIRSKDMFWKLYNKITGIKKL